MKNNQKENLFTNNYIKNFLDNESQVNSKKIKHKFSEIESSLAYYLKSFPILISSWIIYA